jgi:hypothetical protein
MPTGGTSPGRNFDDGGDLSGKTGINQPGDGGVWIDHAAPQRNADRLELVGVETATKNG